MLLIYPHFFWTFQTNIRNKHLEMFLWLRKVESFTNSLTSYFLDPLIDWQFVFSQCYKVSTTTKELNSYYAFYSMQNHLSWINTSAPLLEKHFHFLAWIWTHVHPIHSLRSRSSSVNDIQGILHWSVKSKSALRGSTLVGNSNEPPRKN